MPKIYYIECDVIVSKKVRNRIVESKYRDWIIAPTDDPKTLPADDRRINALRKRLGVKEKETVSFGKIHSVLPLD